MDPQSISGPESFITEVAANKNPFQMIALNVIFYPTGPKGHLYPLGFGGTRQQGKRIFGKNGS